MSKYSTRIAVDQLRSLIEMWIGPSGAADSSQRKAAAPKVAATQQETDKLNAASSSSVHAADDAMNLDSDPPPASPANDDETDRLMAIALDLSLISPETPLLSDQDRTDLAQFFKLTQAQAQLQRILGLERQVVETEKWNLDGVIQLLELTRITDSIPFATREQLFNLKPTSAAKGKGRATDKAGKKSIYHMLPDQAKVKWAGSMCKFSNRLCLLDRFEFLLCSKSPSPKANSFQSKNTGFAPSSHFSRPFWPWY